MSLVFLLLLVTPSFNSSYRILDKSERKRKNSILALSLTLSTGKIIRSLMVQGAISAILWTVPNITDAPGSARINLKTGSLQQNQEA